MNRVGAPCGGRVHWLLLELRADFSHAHDILYNYASHNYVFIRRDRRTLKEVYTVVRTSRRCYRVTYARLNPVVQIEYFSCRNAKATALRLWLCWKKALKEEIENIS